MALVLFFHLLAVLTLVAGKPILLPRQDQGATQAVASPSFDVTIESLGNTTIKAHVKNLGTDAYRLVQRGDILDHVPTKKVNIAGGDEESTFTGVRVEYIVSHLTSDGFVQIEPDQSVASVFDVAEIYALTPGQEYTAVAKGALEYTTLDNEKKFLTFPYTSNNISFTAPTDVTNRLEDRSSLQCSDEYNSIVQEAISRAAKMATAGAQDARSGQASALFQKFFKSTSQDDLDTVAGRLEAIAKEATTTGQLTYYCEPTSEDYCSANVAAMMYPSLNRVVNCPGYYSSTKVSDYCGYLDQAGITLHEYAHATALYAPGTEDIAYGIDSVLEIDTADSLNNADNFAYYASAVFLQCAADDSIEIGTEMNIDLGIDIGTGDDSSSDTTTETPTQTPTTTQEPTYTPEPVPTDGWGIDGGIEIGTGDDGSTWGGNEAGDGGWGDWGSGSDAGTGTGTGTSWSTTSPESSSTTTVSTSTSSDGSTWNMQDFINWIMAAYGNNDAASTSGQTQGQVNANAETMAGLEGSNSDSGVDANPAVTNTISNPGSNVVTVVVTETATAPAAAQATTPPVEAEQVEGEEDCEEE
ncbi:Deuterolysin metalloprotease family-domain-containing protein [Aspergillus stella-maris]|uniref:Deuterolysin metalloprotease family-domain-containing protein n=1 Tax=Aspergillus stella-maris TaxID=1810926 RepID=UPI003CCE488B